LTILAADQEQDDYGDLLPDVDVDAVGVDEENRCEGHVHHGPVEVEGVAHGEDESVVRRGRRSG